MWCVLSYSDWRCLTYYARERLGVKCWKQHTGREVKHLQARNVTALPHQEQAGTSSTARDIYLVLDVQSFSKPPYRIAIISHLISSSLRFASFIPCNSSTPHHGAPPLPPKPFHPTSPVYPDLKIPLLAPPPRRNEGTHPDYRRRVCETVGCFGVGEVEGYACSVRGGGRGCAK